MRSKKEKPRQKKMSFKRVFIGTVLLIMIIGSSMSVAFAEQDIEALLTNWFVKNQEEAIEGLEKSVQDEQEEQTKRLKEALQIEVKEAEEELEHIHVGDRQEKDSTHTHHTQSKEEPKKDETAPDENNEVK